jgi:hypothetical protein
MREGIVKPLAVIVKYLEVLYKKLAPSFLLEMGGRVLVLGESGLAALGEAVSPPSCGLPRRLYRQVLSLLNF